jgi:transcription initiation factor TFIIE subunit alpha
MSRREARQETRPSDLKMVSRTFYYIDYKQFVDVVKYRIYKMRRGLEESMKNVAGLARACADGAR